MSEYRVKWEIDVDAESPEDAAKLARTYQQIGCGCHFFEVTERGTGACTEVGLDELVVEEEP